MISNFVFAVQISGTQNRLDKHCIRVRLIVLNYRAWQTARRNYALAFTRGGLTVDSLILSGSSIHHSCVTSNYSFHAQSLLYRSIYTCRPNFLGSEAFGMLADLISLLWNSFFRYCHPVYLKTPSATVWQGAKTRSPPTKFFDFTRNMQTLAGSCLWWMALEWRLILCRLSREMYLWCFYNWRGPVKLQLTQWVLWSRFSVFRKPGRLIKEASWDCKNNLVRQLLNAYVVVIPLEFAWTVHVVHARDLEVPHKFPWLRCILKGLGRLYVSPECHSRLKSAWKLRSYIQ